MALKDTYRTIKSTAGGLYKEKGSRFIAIASPVSSQEEIKKILEENRKKYHDARHHCYAWMLGYERNMWRSNDDGEPSGTAGKPILGQINSFELTDVLIVVIRYFGGKLLGTGGLITAYSSAASDALRNSEIIERTVICYYRLMFPYSSMNDVMRIIKEEDLIHSDHAFEINCTMKTGVRLSSSEKIMKRFSSVENLSFEYLETV